MNLVDLILLAPFEIHDSVADDLAEQSLVLLDRLEELLSLLRYQEHGRVEDREFSHIVVIVMLSEDVHRLLLVLATAAEKHAIEV